MKTNRDIAVLIPSYDRPDMLKDSLQKWLKIDNVHKVLVVAEASTKEILHEYERVFAPYNNDTRIDYQLTANRLGSVKARNALLELARKNECTYSVMADDDYVPTNKTTLLTMAKELDASNSGLIGGRVIVTKQRKDPDFFLNLPLNLADSISKVAGYVLLDTIHGPRYCEFMPHFFMIKREILDLPIKYDLIYETPTGFREESDFQLQVKNKGYPLLFDPKISIVHLAAETGGDRPQMSESKRIYRKARNHQVFILKWKKSFFKRFWFTFSGLAMLTLYRLWSIRCVLRGIRDGFHYGNSVVD
jgi:GT2 family glycosyltransferase